MADDLKPLIGTWNVEIRRPDSSPHPIAAKQSFAWMAGGAFVLQHVTVEHPDFPVSVAIVGPDTYYYFDSRGVSRIYRMSLGNGSWTIQGETPDFAQRFTGRFSADGDTIVGIWEMSRDGGASWKHDFDMTYTRAGPGT